MLKKGLRAGPTIWSVSSPFWLLQRSASAARFQDLWMRTNYKICQCRAGRDLWASKSNVQRFRRRVQNLPEKRIGTIRHRSDFDLPTPVIREVVPPALFTFAASSERNDGGAAPTSASFVIVSTSSRRSASTARTPAASYAEEQCELG